MSVYDYDKPTVLFKVYHCKVDIPYDPAELSSPAMTGRGSSSNLPTSLLLLGILTAVEGRLIVLRSGLSTLIANNIDPSPTK
jgi:hypothetical protein